MRKTYLLLFFFWGGGWVFFYAPVSLSLSLFWVDTAFFLIHLPPKNNNNNKKQKNNPNKQTNKKHKQQQKNKQRKNLIRTTTRSTWSTWQYVSAQDMITCVKPETIQQPDFEGCGYMKTKTKLSNFEWCNPVWWSDCVTGRSRGGGSWKIGGKLGRNLWERHFLWFFSPII